MDTIDVDGKWLSGERKRIEDTYTYVVPNFGRVILCTDRQAFDAEIEKFKEDLKSYHNALSAAFNGVKTNLENMLVREYLPKWKKHPPANFARYNLEPTENNLEQELRTIVKDMLAKAVSFEPPSVRVVYKNIAPESVKDDDFRKPLESIMLKRGLPHMKVKSLFASFDAAPASEQLDHALRA